MNVPSQRVSPISSPEDYVLPGRPQRASEASLDAYRQSQFLLGPDLELFAEAMNLQLRLVKDAYPSKYRTHALAAIMALWSRSFSYLGDALLLTTRGSYMSTVPLVKATTEVIAAQEGLRSGEMEDHHRWLAETLRPDEAFKALEFKLGRYFAGSVLAGDALLGSIYRPASDIARPSFGVSLLQVAPESNNIRLAITFGDSSFHLGWAELILGWLLALGIRQIQVILDADDIFPISEELRADYEKLRARTEEALRRNDRCHLDEVQDGNDRRYLIHNFRRTSGASPKKVLL